jgi:hypothetical protein
MEKPGVWGDDVEIRALEEILDRIIRIYSSESKTMEPINKNLEEDALLKDVSPVNITYHGKRHYNALVEQDKVVISPWKRKRCSTVSYIPTTEKKRKKQEIDNAKKGKCEDEDEAKKRHICMSNPTKEEHNDSNINIKSSILMKYRRNLFDIHSIEPAEETIACAYNIVNLIDDENDYSCLS